MQSGGKLLSILGKHDKRDQRKVKVLVFILFRSVIGARFCEVPSSGSMFYVKTKKQAY